MPGPWIDDARLTVLVSDATRLSGSQSLPARYAELITRGNISAAADITSILSGRNYSADQIDSWDRRVEFNEDLGQYWVAVRGALYSTYSDLMINKLDRRKDLMTVQITVDGIIVLPGGPSTGPDGVVVDGGGTISGGRIDETSFRVSRTTVF